MSDLQTALRKVFSDDELGDLLDVLFARHETLTREPYVTLVNALVKAREMPS